MAELCELSCKACRGDLPKLTGEELAAYASHVTDWNVVDGHHLHRRWKFPDFVGALAFVNRVGALAEEEGHHPDLSLTWGRVDVEIWTHKVGGLTVSDFILASKIDRIPAG